MPQVAERKEQFKSEASRAGAKVQEFTSLAEAADFVIGLARQHAAKAVVLSAPSLAVSTRLADQLMKNGLEVTCTGQCQSEIEQQKLREACVRADIGISEAATAIAETGTLVIASDDGSSRLAAVLPRLHITIVNCNNIVATMEEAMARIKSLGITPNSPVPTYATFITGRNTTADIPGAILARAQGPAEEHILLLNYQTEG